MKLKPYRKKIDSLLAERRLAVRTAKQERQNLKRLAEHVADCEEAQKILQSVAQTMQQQVHTRLAGVVTRCLEAVFDEPYTFRIDFEQKRGRTEARLVFERNGVEVDPMTASGGGVLDVASFALRVACLIIVSDRYRRVLILDEPFRFVSLSYRCRIKDLIEQLSEEMDIQFIIVTHMDELKIGKVVEL